MSEKSSSRAWLFVAPTVLLMAWGGNQFSPLLALYRRTFGYSDVEVDVVFAAYIAGLAPAFLLAGRLAARFGRRPLLLASLLLAVAAGVLLAFGPSSLALLVVGRLASGASVAIAMTVGTEWIASLSTDVDHAHASRRASLTITAGFLLGAVAAGTLAQWAPAPTLVPYGVHLVLSVLAGVLLFRAPDGPPLRPVPGSFMESFRLSPEAGARFRGVVVPLAPWVFAAPALAFAISPALVADRLGTFEIGFATLSTLVALGCGVLVQSVVPRIPVAVRASTALVLLAVGALVVAAVVGFDLPPVTLLVSCVLLGSSYGIGMLSGLIEVRGLAGPGREGPLVGLYYALTYIGFLLPVILSALATGVRVPVLLAVVAALAVATAALVAVRARRSPIPHLTRPGARDE